MVPSLLLRLRAARGFSTLGATFLLLTACGHSQPDKDNGSSSSGGGPPPAGGVGTGGTGANTSGCGGAAGQGAKAGAAGASCGGSDGGGLNADGTYSTDKSCKALEKRFDELLPSLLVCTAGTTRCDAKFRNRLACGCDIFVATEDFNGVALIQGVITDWDKSTCPKLITCPDLDCAPPVTGSCAGNGATGICTTK